MNRYSQMLMAVLVSCWVSGQIKGLEQRLKRLEKHHGTTFSANSSAVDASYSDPEEAAIQCFTENGTPQFIQPGLGGPVPSMQHSAKSHGRCDNQQKGPPSSSQAGRHCRSADSTSTIDLIERLRKRSQEVLNYLQESQASA